MYLRQYTEGYHTLKTRWCKNTLFYLSCPLGKSLQKYLTLNTNWCKNTLGPFCITLIALWELTFFWALLACTIKVTNNLKTNIQYKTKPPTKIGLFKTAKKTHVLFFLHLLFHCSVKYVHCTGMYVQCKAGDFGGNSFRKKTVRHKKKLFSVRMRIFDV